MMRFSIQLAGLALALMPTPAGVQAPGSIEGTVVAVRTSTPVPRAKVTLTTTGGRQVAVLSASIDGRFSVPEISPGEYRVAASQDGYVSTRGVQVTVVSGRKTEVSVSIVADGAISGRIVDWDGIPVVGVQVQALTLVQDAQGLRRLNVFKSAQTNDLGEYRIYWLPPGQYYVRADPASSDNSAYAKYVVLSLARPGSTSASEKFVPTYFPGVVDSSGARRIDIHSGETSTGVDIRLNDVRARQISGVLSVVGSRATSVRLTPRNSAEGLGDVMATTADQSSAFRFEGVVPGAYLLTASTLDADGRTMFGRIPVDVGNTDIENVAVSLTEGFDLRIRLTIEGRLRRSDDPQLVVNLRPAIPATPFPTVERTGDDELRMHHFMPGDYSVAVLSLKNQLNQNGSPVGGGLYLKSAQYGGSDALTSGLHIDGPTSGILDIVMADGAGSLSGAVLDDQKKPASGITVVLIPEPRLRGRGDLYKTVMTGAGGKFEISGITPGQYKVFSWEDAAQGSWQYPDFLDAYEDRGQSVRIDRGKTDPITVQLIPPR